MRREFHENKDFHTPDMDPPVEFSMEDYDKAVQDPEYIRRISEPVAVTPVITPAAPTTAQPEPTHEPEIKQEPTEEGPITELPQEERTQTKPRKSREESNLETGLNGPKWQCTETHGRRLRYRNNFTEENEEPGHEWDSENWDNIHHIEDQDLEAHKKKRD